jgi:hypothetical protein
MKTSMGRPNLEIEVQADVGVEGTRYITVQSW